MRVQLLITLLSCLIVLSSQGSVNSWFEINEGDSLPLPAARRAHSMSSVDEGIVVFGGYDGNNLNDVWLLNMTLLKNSPQPTVYNPYDAQWIQLHNGANNATSVAPGARGQATLISFNGDLVLFGGGGATLLDAYNDVWIFHTPSRIWSPILSGSESSTHPVPRRGMASNWHQYGGYDSMLVFGGVGPTAGDVNTFDVWELSLSGPSPYTWTMLTNATTGAPSARSLHSVVSYDSSAFYVFGGKSNSDFTASDELWKFDRATSTWTLTSNSGGPTARYGHVAAYIGGKMVISGGQDTSGDYLEDSWIFDFGGSTWQQLGGVQPSNRSQASSAVYLINRSNSTGSPAIVMFGGFSGGNYYVDTWLLSVNVTCTCSAQSEVCYDDGKCNCVSSGNPQACSALCPSGYNGTIDTGCTPICSMPCQNQGKCVLSDTCYCVGTGYNGDQCQNPICNCAHNETCLSPGVCNCSAYWQGNTCNTPKCLPECSNGGTCLADNICDCSYVDYNGTYCTEPICDPPCQHSGICYKPHACNCTETSYTGYQCEILIGTTTATTTTENGMNNDTTTVSDTSVGMSTSTSTTGVQEQGILGLGKAGNTGISWDYFIFGAIALIILIGIISIIIFSVKERKLRGDRMIDMSEI